MDYGGNVSPGKWRKSVMDSMKVSLGSQLSEGAMSRKGKNRI
jgi:hypothetical protein